MAETYTLHVAGLTRELTICKVNDHMDIAAFIMLGDAELTVAAAAELLKKCPDFDILLTAEAKGIPLAHEMSRQSGKPYICARKGVKLYMPDPVVVEDQSITTAGKQKLVIDRKELEKMNGKRAYFCSILPSLYACFVAKLAKTPSVPNATAAIVPNLPYLAALPAIVVPCFPNAAPKSATNLVLNLPKAFPKPATISPAVFIALIPILGFL